LHQEKIVERGKIISPFSTEKLPVRARAIMGENDEQLSISLAPSPLIELLKIRWRVPFGAWHLDKKGR
jgi:hypothetical protein